MAEDSQAQVPVPRGHEHPVPPHQPGRDDVPASRPSAEREAETLSVEVTERLKMAERVG